MGIKRNWRLITAPMAEPFIERIEAEARKRELSRAAFIRLALVEFINKNEKQPAEDKQPA